MLRTAIFSAAILLSACDGIFNGAVCTDAGCQSGLQITFNIEDDSLYTGDYSVVVTTASNQQLSCTFTLVQTGASCGGTNCIENQSCDQFNMETNDYPPIIDYDFPEDRIFVFYPVLEGELNISINKDDAELSSLLTEPVYETNRPNGPRCDPVCRNGQIEMLLNRE